MYSWIILLLIGLVAINLSDEKMSWGGWNYNAIPELKRKKNKFRGVYSFGNGGFGIC